MKENWKHSGFFLVSVIVITSLIISFLPSPTGEAQASALKISYNGQTINFKNQRVDVSVDGELLPISSDAPGLELINDKKDERYMVSLTDVYVNGLGAEYTYDEATGGITLSLYDTVIEMTMDDKYALVNGVKKEMPFAPTEVTYVKTGIKKILVDSEFITEALGFGYDWKNNSDVSGSVFITTPVLYTYDSQTHIYTDSDWTITYDDKKINLNKAKAPHIGNILFVPVKKVFQTKIGANYNYNSTNGNISLEKNGITLNMTLNSTQAAINGEPVELKQAPRKVRWENNSYTCLMVPLQQTAFLLNIDCSIDDGSHMAALTRQDAVYNEWTSTLPASTEYKNLTSISALRVNKQDILCFYTDKEPTYSVTSTSNKIKIVLSETVSQPGELDYAQDDPYLFRSIHVRQKTPKRTVISIYKKNNKSYVLKKTKSYVKITISNVDEISGNGIKIAIDCGHGNNTAGKRTPPMPFDIDIDNDGVVDIKKGEQYREHYASVGVGKYLYKALVRCDFQVYKSAFGAEDVPLVTRQENIKAAGCDYSVCIHWNAFGDGRSFNSAEGLGVYYYSQAAYAGDSKKFATVLQKNLLNGTSQKDRGIDGQNQYAMCNTKFLGTKASVLIELAFMTNKREATTMMASSKYWKESAEEICRGICEYTGVKYVEP